MLAALIRSATSGAPVWISSSPMSCMTPQVKAISASAPVCLAITRQIPATWKLFSQKPLRSKLGPALNAPVTAEASTSVRRVSKPRREAASSTLDDSRAPRNLAELARRRILAEITGSFSMLLAMLRRSESGLSNCLIRSRATLGILGMLCRPENSVSIFIDDSPFDILKRTIGEICESARPAIVKAVKQSANTPRGLPTVPCARSGAGQALTSVTSSPSAM